MAELKTKENDQSVEQFINRIEDEHKRRDCFTLIEIMKQVTQMEPKMWGDNMIGFGRYHYKYASGREGDWFITGFAPRKDNLTLYIMSGFEQYEELLAKLGKHKTGKSCLYVQRLEDVNVDVLKELVEKSVEHVTSTNS